ncbi:MAG: UDP-N-acetylglucosamine 4,6-dehydratase (inverting) [Patescibacteria group bacterium]
MDNLEFSKQYKEKGIEAQRRYPNEQLIQFLAANFFSIPKAERKDIKILEIGCGSGANLWMIAEEGFSAFGLDISSEGIELSRENLSSRNLSADLRVGNMKKLEFPDNYFDAIVDVVSMQHTDLAGHLETYKEIYRALKPGGKFFQWQLGEKSICYVESGGQKIDRLTIDNINNLNVPYANNGLTCFLNPGEAEALLKQAGLTNIKIEVFTRTYKERSQVVEYLAITALKEEVKNNIINNKNMFDDKTILITGGTGSFGKSFTRYLLNKYKVKKLIIFSRDELKQSIMEKEFSDERLRFFIGDIRDLPRLERAFHGVDIVIHAAALKQVPLIEYNPFEAIKTNVVGSQNVINAAIDLEVDRVLLISTDKSAQPVNLYGASKLCAEKLFTSGNSYAGGKTKFSAVRYGNVVGSRGSIVETLLESKNPLIVNITDERMTRFWMSLNQACELVVFALENMEGGEIFIPKAPSMKLVDLFNILAPGCEKNVIGIRPGEKMHEILLTEQEATHSLDMNNYYVVLPEFRESSKHEKYFTQGKKLDSNFNFASNTNSNWLDEKGFLELINS